MVIDFAVQSDGQNRHIINRLHLHQGHSDTRRNTVEVGTELFREPHQALIGILPALETNHHAALARGGGGVDIFHTGDLPEQFFHGARRTFLHFLGAESRHLRDDIDHRNLDLRLFLPREHQDGEKPQEQ